MALSSFVLLSGNVFCVKSLLGITTIFAVERVVRGASLANRLFRACARDRATGSSSVTFNVRGCVADGIAGIAAVSKLTAALALSIFRVFFFGDEFSRLMMSAFSKRRFATRLGTAIDFLLFCIGTVSRSFDCCFAAFCACPWVPWPVLGRLNLRCFFEDGTETSESSLFSSLFFAGGVYIGFAARFCRFFPRPRRPLCSMVS